MLRHRACPPRARVPRDHGRSSLTRVLGTSCRASTRASGGRFDATMMRRSTSEGRRKWRKDTHVLAPSSEWASSRSAGSSGMRFKRYSLPRRWPSQRAGPRKNVGSIAHDHDRVRAWFRLRVYRTGCGDAANRPRLQRGSPSLARAVVHTTGLGRDLVGLQRPTQGKNTRLCWFFRPWISQRGRCFAIRRGIVYA